MRIVIDVQGTQTGSRFRGIGRYVRAFVDALLPVASAHEVVLVYNQSLEREIESWRGEVADILPAVRWVGFDSTAFFNCWEEHGRWSNFAAEIIREAFIESLLPDVVLVSSLFEGASEPAVLSVGRLSFATPSAVILYDLIPYLNQEEYLGYEPIGRWYFEKLDSLRRADLKLSISEYSRKEAISALELNAEDVVNISSACSSLFARLDYCREDSETVLQRLGVDGRFVLYSGALESRKNLPRLIEAFAGLPETLRLTTKLLLVGKAKVEEVALLSECAHRFGVISQIVFTGYIVDEDLVLLLNRCDAFIFPSLHEGFGLPVLEAMACGAPVICSDRTSVPEVIELNEALFDPLDVIGITEKLSKVLSDEMFAESLRAHGLLQAKKFSWPNTANLALSALENRFGKGFRSAAMSWKDVLLHLDMVYAKLLNGLACIEYPHSEEFVKDAAICIARNRSVSEWFLRSNGESLGLSWQVEGPFDSSYSLALVNRETALALAGNGLDVSLHSTEGPGDFEPSAEFLNAHLDVNELYLKSKVSVREVAVTSRLLYPPRVEDMRSRLNFLHQYAWEESGFPLDWAKRFNKSLQGVFCLSRHVEKIMKDNGVHVPTFVSGAGVDHWDRVLPDKTMDFCFSEGDFRFLHVSSCFPRKGVDVLLKAYGEFFSLSDGVQLVVKTFKNPHNDVSAWLSNARVDNPDYPKVVLIEDDLDEASLKSLYEQCHVLVAPSRAEGFGLPLAEAMLSGLPVITVNWGGQLDFCDEDCSWLVDFEFKQSESHLGVFDSVWAEPDCVDLGQAMRDAYALPYQARSTMASLGAMRLREYFSWARVAERMKCAALSVQNMPLRRNPVVGWVSTWNSKCGIATYSKHLLENFYLGGLVLAPSNEVLVSTDSERVLRCWELGGRESLDGLSDAIDLNGVDVLIIQFNNNFFEYEAFSNFLVEQTSNCRSVILELHSTGNDPSRPDKDLELLSDCFKVCTRIFVHSISDLNRMKQLGFVENVAIFPHGIIEREDSGPVLNPGGEYVMATYGFFLPHKGLKEVVEALAILRQRGVRVRLKMVNAEYPVSESSDLICDVKDLAESLGVSKYIDFHTDFLEDDASFSLLEEADVVVFAYQNTRESASGAVRYGIASGQAVLVSPAPIFDDVAPAVFKLDGFSPDLIAAGVQDLLLKAERGDGCFREKMLEAARWRSAHSYAVLGERYANVARAIFC